MLSNPSIQQLDRTLLHFTPKQVVDLLGHSISEITDMYFFKRENARRVWIIDGFTL